MSRESEARDLYDRLLASWNQRDAAAYAALFTEDGRAIGFDGSIMDGPAVMEATLRQIFADHPTAEYVGKIRNVRVIDPDAVILLAVAGMVPRGQADIDPKLNAVQTMVAARHGGQWQIAAFQNTPAAFHGRPQLVEELTEELRQVLTARR
jgi:uncharacterized protein (TIGR02246 family)